MGLDLTQTIDALKDQTVDPNTRRDHNTQQRHLVAQSDRATQNAFTMGIPSNANKELDQELKMVEEAATPDKKGAEASKADKKGADPSTSDKKGTQESTASQDSTGTTGSAGSTGSTETQGSTGSFTGKEVEEG